MVLPLLQTLLLRKDSKQKTLIKNTAAAAAAPAHGLTFVKAPRRSQRNKASALQQPSRLDVFERGVDDIDDDDDSQSGMVVRPAKMPNPQTVNINALAEHKPIDPATFKPGSLLNPTQREAYSPPHTYEIEKEDTKQQDDDDDDDDDEEVPLALVKFKIMSQKTGYEQLQMPSEGWSFSRRAISYDQLYYRLRAKQISDDSASDDDSSDELYIDTAYNLEFRSQRNRKYDDQSLRHCSSASKVTLSSTKQSKPVHVQVEAMSAQTVNLA
jgi:hypothetical protein